MNRLLQTTRTTPARLLPLLSVVLLVVAVFFGPTAYAQNNPQTLSERTDDIARQLECLVCENSSLEQSTMPVAEELQIIIQTRIKAGDTDKEIIAYVTRNYANFVQPRPGLGGSALIVWIVAGIVLAGGGAFLWHIHERRASAIDQLLMEFSVRDRLANKRHETTGNSDDTSREEGA